jgi:pimeloyl-ACP methyl ester carboxylesterase
MLTKLLVSLLVLDLVGTVLAVLFLGRLYVRQNSLVFRPRPDLSRSPASLSLAFEEIHLCHQDGTQAHAWWIPCRASDKAVLFFYGSESSKARELPILHFFHSLGVSVLTMDYPGYGKSVGSPNEQSCYSAAEAAWTFLQEIKNFAVEDVFIFGHSLGSAIGIYLGAKYGCRGLVVHSGFTSVPDLAVQFFPYLPAKCVRPLCRTKMNSLERISRCSCPLLLLHSMSDEHIPVEQARQLYAQAPGPKKIVLYNGSHFGNQWLHDPDVHAAIVEMFSTSLED